MRGARGIEFGVDLPAIPAIGLGSALPTSVKKSANHTPPTQTDRGDGWGFGDWTRFVGAWKNKSEAASRDKEHRESVSQDSPQPQPQHQPQKHEAPSVKHSSENLADDEVVRSSTDKLSAVFDWLIERVPAPKRILGVDEGDTNEAGNGENGRRESKAGLTGKEQEAEAVMNFEILEKQAKQVTSPEKKLGALAATYTVVNHSVGSSTTSSSTSEIKRRMDSEKKKPKELRSKDDLERFYVALTRKMYDEGL